MPVSGIRRGVVAGWAFVDQYAAKKGDASEAVMASARKIDRGQVGKCI